MIRSRQALMAQQREARRPRREERILDVGGVGSSAASGGASDLVVIKFDGSRSGKRYTGHIVEDDGSQGDAVQFRFLNDPGSDDILDPNDYVFAVPIAAWDEDNACWSGDSDKYWTRSPWAAFA